MDPQVATKLFELLKLVSRKSELVKQYAERYALNCRSDSNHELSLHKRDEHRGHFDIDYDLELQRRQEDELAETRAAYNAVCEQIKSLEAVLEASLPLVSV